MSGQTPTTEQEARPSVALSELPIDELLVYGSDLGLILDARMGHGELLRRVRARQALLAELDRDALLDVVVWARRPVRESASKEALARQIAQIKKVDTQGLSHRGVVALARLRGIPVRGDEPTTVLADRIRGAEPFWDRIARKRRRLIGGIISRLVDSAVDEEEGKTYRFLPEESGKTSLKADISEEGVVGGIARRLRGAADDYIRQKLDEIEDRIDRKLDEIDRRLEEWRDREIANRLKIIRITLIASVLVAVLSLGYSLLKPH